MGIKKRNKKISYFQNLPKKITKKETLDSKNKKIN